MSETTVPAATRNMAMRYVITRLTDITKSLEMGTIPNSSHQDLLFMDEILEMARRIK